MQERLAERRADRRVRELLDRERQLAELQDRDQVLGLGQRVAADAAAGVIWTWPLGIESWMTGALMTSPSRTIAKYVADVAPRCSPRTSRLPSVLEREVDRPLARLVRRRCWRAATWSPENRTQLIGGRRRTGVRDPCRDPASGPALAGVLPSGTKSRRPVVPTSSRIWSTFGDARHLDHDPVVALDDDLGLRDAGLVDAVEDDLAHDVEVVAGRASCPRRAGPGTRSAGRPGGRGRAWSRACAAAGRRRPAGRGTATKLDARGRAGR